MRKPDPSRYAPPGMNVRQEVIAFLWGYGACVVFSLRYFIRYGIAYSDLFIRDFGTNIRYFKEGAQMDSFASLTENVFSLFPVLLFCLLLWAALHYLSHYQGSRSIYTMRRLPSRWELHRRCLALPFAGAVICLLSMVLLFLFFYGFYLFMTPDAVMNTEQAMLHPEKWMYFWRGLFA